MLLRLESLSEPAEGELRLGALVGGSAREAWGGLQGAHREGRGRGKGVREAATEVPRTGLGVAHGERTGSWEGRGLGWDPSRLSHEIRLASEEARGDSGVAQMVARLGWYRM